MKGKVLALLLFLFLGTALHSEEPQFVIFTGSYNNEKWVERHLASIASQSYKNWECIYINDRSTDKTGSLAEAFVHKHKLQDKITIINHKKRRGLVSNMSHYLRQVDPKKIIVIVDGDDYLANKDALKRVAKAYKNPSVWMTYGNYVSSPYNKSHKSLCRPFPSEVLKKNSFRKYRFISSHLRTFYAKLFHNILEKDLQEKGAYFQIAGDVVTMLPMLEMSSKGHIRFIDEILLKYNTQNPASDYLRRKEQMRVEALIRKRTVYKPLEKLF